MPTSRVSSFLALTLSGVLGGSLLVGCTDDASTSTPSRVQVAVPSDAAQAPEEELPVPPNLVKTFNRILDQRATAILEDDRKAFLAVLDDNEGLRETQDDYFDNLTQLPLSAFGYDLRRRSLVRNGDTYSVVVDLTTQLGGFDVLPVLSQFRFQFIAKGAKKRRFVLSAVVDPVWEEANDIVRQPWEERPIQVRTAPGVLGIFDNETVVKSASIVDSVSRGIAAVSGTVPLEWSQSVTLYSLSDTSFQSRLGVVPGGDADRLDGLAIAIPAGPNGPASEQIAAVRFVLNPRMLGATRPELDRLVRHELTHVAVGERDDRTPLWLSEGLAEYVSVRPLAPEERRINGGAIKAATRGRFKALPVDDDFNGPDQQLNYALSWFACEYIAATYGESTLWTLLEDLNAEDADVATRLDITLGINSRTLARKAAKLIVATYAPAPPPVPPVPTVPPDPLADPAEATPTPGNTVDG